MTSHQTGGIKPVLRPFKIEHGNDPSSGSVGVWFLQSSITGEPEQPNHDSKVVHKIKELVAPTPPKAHVGEDVHVVSIRMTEQEYERFFATDHEGTNDFKDGVEEPEGGRLEWVKKKFEEQQPKAQLMGEVVPYAEPTTKEVIRPTWG